MNTLVEIIILLISLNMPSDLSGTRSDVIHFCKCGRHSKYHCKVIGHTHSYCFKIKKKMTTSDKVRVACLVAKISQKELAERIGYNYGSLRDSLSRNSFSFKMLVKIELELGEELGSKEL